MCSLLADDITFACDLLSKLFRNPKLKSIPALSSDLRNIVRLSWRIEEKESIAICNGGNMPTGQQ